MKDVMFDFFFLVFSAMSDNDEEQSVPPVVSEATMKAIDRPGANTGVKGVLADYADAKQKMELLDRVKNQVAWLNVAELGMVAATVREQEELERKEKENLDRRADSDSDDGLDDDDEFMAQYRCVILRRSSLHKVVVFFFLQGCNVLARLRKSRHRRCDRRIDLRLELCLLSRPTS
jgi:hypothetical protein